MVDWLIRNRCVDTDDRELFAGLTSYEAADKLLSLIINGSNFKVFSGGLLLTEQHALYLAITLKGISKNIVQFYVCNVFSVLNFLPKVASDCLFFPL